MAMAMAMENGVNVNKKRKTIHWQIHTYMAFFVRTRNLTYYSFIHTCIHIHTKKSKKKKKGLIDR
jgi:hypothetical protein